MEIIFFGQLADLAGRSSWQTQAFQDTDSLRHFMESSLPGLKQVKYMVAVNRQMVQANTMLTGTETIALMPPFSGG